MFKPASIGGASKLLLALTILAAGGLYLLGNGRASLWDRDEPRYAQCSRQMLYGFPGPGGHGPDLIVPRFLDKPRTEKPPFMYWCQALAMRAFGDNAFSARLPSSVAMILVLILLAVVLYRAAGPARAAWAVFILATSALTIMSAKMCLTDAVLLLWMTVAQICVFAVYRGNRSWLVTLTLWIAIGLGGITKGPIVLATLGSTLIALAIFDFAPERKLQIRWWRHLRPWIGLPVVVAIAAPWLYVVEHREPGFVAALFAAGKRHAAALTEKHVSPPGYYLALIWGLLFPWSLLLPTTLVIAWRHRHLPLIRYALSMILGIWVFQELMPTKLPFYMLPAFPALAFLTADTLVRCLRRECDDLLRPAFILAVVIWSIAVLALGAAPWALAVPKFELRPLVPWGATVALSIASILYAIIVFALFRSRRLASAAIAMGLGMILIFGLLFASYLPNARYLQTSNRIADVIRTADPANAGVLHMIEYKEPSLAFYRGGPVLEQRSADDLQKTSPAQWPQWIVMPKTIWNRTPYDIQAKLDVIGGPIHGLDYAGKIDGYHIVDVMLLRKKS